MGRFFFAGDFCCSNPYSINFSERLATIISNCDYRYLNFEGPLQRGCKSTANDTILYQSDDSPKWCKEKGFEIVGFANNHALDFGEQGLIETMKAFHGLITLGAGNWEEAYSIKAVDTNECAVGFIAATSSDLASFKDRWTDANKIGCANLMSAEIERVVEKKNEFCDVLILIAHAGIEFCSVPLPELRDRYRRLIELGVDAIIAMHPHVPQGCEVYMEKPIVYSLGNFCFDPLKQSSNMPELWNHGLSVVLDIKANRTIEYEIIPICNNSCSLDLESDEVVLNHLTWLNEVINNDIEYMRALDKEVYRLFPMYRDWLLGGFNAYEANASLRAFYHFVKGCFQKPNYKAAMHQLREESTRWLITRYLKNNSNSLL